MSIVMFIIDVKVDSTDVYMLTVMMDVESVLVDIISFLSRFSLMYCSPISINN